LPADTAEAARAGWERYPEATAPIAYAVRERPLVFARPDSALGFMHLDFRDGVRVLERRGPWTRIAKGHTKGWVATDAVSDVWLLVSKKKRAVYVYRGTELLRRYDADVGRTPEGDKVRRAARYEREHYRTPEGAFFVCTKNPNSEFYRALVLNYPTERHAERGLAEGLISQEEYAAIVKADLSFQAPPMSTPLGGLIEIHGNGSGRGFARTRGCVALKDIHMDQLWDLVHVGTPVLVE
jgi:hypothetical protein